MHEVLHAKQTEAGRTQATPAKQPASTKRHIQRTIAPTRFPLYTQAWKNQPPPWLHLPTSLNSITPIASQQASQEETLVQKKVEPVPAQDTQTSTQENNTGMPDTLKAGIEALSGIPMDDVAVHYNSPQPAQVQALAYTQGTHIHVAPGQERHLAHEAWHAVQQKQGRVQPTLHARGITINDDQHLEREADTMGGQALQHKRQHSLPSTASDESDKEAERLATGRMTQLKGKNALTSSHSASSGTPDTETVVQMVETVPAKGTKMKVKLIREKLAALIREAKDRHAMLEQMRLILISSFAAIEDPRSVAPDRALKVGALASYIENLMARIILLNQKLEEIANENNSKEIPFDFGVEELHILNIEHMIATGPELDKIMQWFEEGAVKARKQEHKLKGPAAPGVTPATVTVENAEAFLKLPAAPLMRVPYLVLLKSIGPINYCAYQGPHRNKEKNLPTPRYQHKCPHLIELSINVEALSGGRAVVDIETGNVYITEHYGQNIVKKALSLATKVDRTAAENQELHALLFLKKLINDFVLVTDIPEKLHQTMMDLACSAYLENFIALEHFNPPPTGIAFQTWCIKTLPLDILRRSKIDTNQIAWTRWMLYCHGQPQPFVIPDGCPLSSDFMLLTLNPTLPVLRRVSYVVDLLNIIAPYGTIVILETRFATGQNKRVCFIRAGSITSPQWIKFGEVPTYTVNR